MGSRIGEMPAYTTVKNTLKCFKTHRQRGADYNISCEIRQCPKLHTKRDHRIGSANKMNIGIAATYCELEDVNLSAIDIDGRRKLIDR